MSQPEKNATPTPNPSTPSTPPAAGDSSSEPDDNDASVSYAGGITSCLNSTQIRDAGSITLSGSAGGAAPRLSEDISRGESTDRYVIDREIDRGGMGAILSAADRDLRREVAMKVALTKGRLSEGRVKRFIEEAQITGQLEHPNIVPIHELGVDANGRAFFTMKMVHGESLDKTLTKRWGRRKAPLTPADLSEMLDIVLKACDGLAFAHSRGVIHRDLKPANVMVGEFGEVLVMDWGLARILGKDHVHANSDITSVRSDDGTLTQDGDVVGTPHYMPPEQAEGLVHELDERSDVYSLGAVLYEMLTGRPPFTGKNALDVLTKVSHGGLAAPELAAAAARHSARTLGSVPEGDGARKVGPLRHRRGTGTGHSFVPRRPHGRSLPLQSAASDRQAALAASLAAGGGRGPAGDGTGSLGLHAARRTR